MLMDLSGTNSCNLCDIEKTKFFLSLSSMDLENYLLGNEAKTYKLTSNNFIIIFLLKLHNFEAN